MYLFYLNYYHNVYNITFVSTKTVFRKSQKLLHEFPGKTVTNRDLKCSVLIYLCVVLFLVYQVIGPSS